MSKPHVCPRCEGSGQHQGEKCHPCEGTGTVWEPESAQEATVGDASSDPTDLTYRRE